MTAIVRQGLFAASVLLQTALLGAAAPADEARAPGSLAGQVLVAAPEMGDPRFERTVILLVEHNAAGAFGIVLNRPVGTQTFAGLLAAVGETDSGLAGSVRIFAGGPVQPEAGFVVHSADYRRPETIAVTDRLSVTSNVKALEDIGHGKGPAKSLVAFGYAGWGAGQLEKEMDAGAWAAAEADPALVFDADRDTLWDDAWKRRTERL